MFIDSHVHLDFRPLATEQERVIASARTAGVTAMINVGSSLAGSRASVALAEKFEPVYATVGVHPHDAGELTPEALDELARLAAADKVVAIGEIGLDYSRMRNTPEAQRLAFISQLELARCLSKPVVIHNRDADADILAILCDHPGLTGVVHFFSSGRAIAEALLDLGFSLGFTGVITFTRASGPTPEERERDLVAAQIPADRILIETDSPFAAPEPYRGRPNEPAYVVEVARRLAVLRCVPIEEIGEITTGNCRRLFGI